MMMRKKTKMAWSVALSAAMAAGLLLPAIQQIPVTAQPTKLQR